MQHPYDIHWKATKRILQYVQGTRNFQVHYDASSPLELELVGFSDSDCLGDPNDRKSTPGYVFMIFNVPICCSIKKKNTIYLSSAKAEYRGVVNATTQCVWLQGIIGEIGFAFDSPTVI